MKLFFKVLISALLVASFSVYAKDSFNVELQCKGQDKEYCDIVKNDGNKKSFILKNMRYPQVNKVNDKIFHAYGSCGSPCQYHFFIAENQEDQSKEFIALNKKNNCLIESNSKKKLIYARKLFTEKKVVIANLKNKEFENIPLDIAVYNSFQDKSYFDGNGEFHLVAMLADIDINGNSLYFNKIIKKTCE